MNATTLAPDLYDYDAAAMAEDENLRRTIKLVFATIYILLFFVGTIGNGYVIVMLINIFSSLSSKKTSAAQRMSVFGTTHVFIYVLGLSIVDFLVITHLPLLVFDMIEGQWIFGTVVCKLYWMGESVNKLLSSLLMTVLSWDRYLAVCSPIKSFRVRNNSVALGVVIGCACLATILLIPVLAGSDVRPVNKVAQFVDHNVTIPGETISKCIFDTNSSFFMLYTFTFGFAVPALLISYFYLRVILRLRSNAKSVRKHSDSFTTTASSSSAARIHKVTQRIVAVVLFYFFCWTPYWSLNVMLQFDIALWNLPQLLINSLFFSAHILVCFNSAANPLLYALINRELRHQHNQALQKRRRSVHLSAPRIQSDRSSIAKDSPSDFFLPNDRRRFSYHQRPSDSSVDPTVLASLSARCRASLPQTKLTKSLMGLRTLMTLGRTTPGSMRGPSAAKRTDARSTSFSQPSLSTPLSVMPRDDSSFLDVNAPAYRKSSTSSINTNNSMAPNGNGVTILVRGSSDELRGSISEKSDCFL